MSRCRLLVVDDHSDTLTLFSAYFGSVGFDVTCVESASEALGRVRSPLDAIITDLAMPGISGVEFIQMVRAMKMPQVPIVVVTGQVLDPGEIVREALKCCRVVTKPCDLEWLAGLVRALADGCRHDCEHCQNVARVHPRAPLPLERSWA